MAKYDYIPCELSQIPAGVTWTTPRREQGQIVTTSFGGFGRGPFDRGDPFMCVCDQSVPWTDRANREQYYRLA